ncbi:hypothetical protein QBC38DRAFT_457324 [Podospora fimiseda]|uniref:Ecp2 effector protein-like domain-containing protein n=1 Tax=Podospora fimiseda TaxID=252190 RepID=A0AAN7GUW3_9PEZI|nr:hypothetical protein QBC38DRAFT_457324 [Podospora fimiseda]
MQLSHVIFVAFINAITPALGVAVLISNTENTVNRSENTSGDNIATCTARPGISQVSRASPTVQNCLGLIDKLEAKPSSWRLSLPYRYHNSHKTLENYRTCALGITSKQYLTQIDLSRENMVDVIIDSIKRFQTKYGGGRPRIGAKGDIFCNTKGKETFRGTWDLSRTPRIMYGPEDVTSITFQQRNYECVSELQYVLISERAPLAKDCFQMLASIPINKNGILRGQSLDIARFGTCVFNFRAEANTTLVVYGSMIRDIMNHSFGNFRVQLPGKPDTRLGTSGRILCGHLRLPHGYWRMDITDTR